MRGCLLRCRALGQGGSLGSELLASLLVIDAGPLVVDRCLHLFPEPSVVGCSQVSTLHSFRRGGAALVLLASGKPRLELGGVDAYLCDTEVFEVAGQRLKLAPRARLPSRSRQRLACTSVVDDHAPVSGGANHLSAHVAPASTKRRRVPWSMVFSGVCMSADLAKRCLEKRLSNFQEIALRHLINRVSLRRSPDGGISTWPSRPVRLCSECDLLGATNCDARPAIALLLHGQGPLGGLHPPRCQAQVVQQGAAFGCGNAGIATARAMLVRPWPASGRGSWA